MQTVIEEVEGRPEDSQECVRMLRNQEKDNNKHTRSKDKRKVEEIRTPEDSNRDLNMRFKDLEFY